MSKAAELQKLLQAQKTYLNNISQLLLKPEYQTDFIRNHKVEVSNYVKTLEMQLSLEESYLRMHVLRLLTRISASDSNRFDISPTA